MRSRSVGLLGLWSRVSSIALLLRHRTTRESPTWTTSAYKQCEAKQRKTKQKRARRVRTSPRGGDDVVDEEKRGGSGTTSGLARLHLGHEHAIRLLVRLHEGQIVLPAPRKYLAINNKHKK